MSDNRLFPVQKYGLIPWAIGMEAWLAYAAEGHGNQSCERIAERGGFGISEMDRYVPDWRVRVSEMTALQTELAQAHTDIKWLKERKARDKLRHEDAQIEIVDLVVELEAAKLLLEWIQQRQAPMFFRGWPHTTDIRMRKDGQEYSVEGEWLHELRWRLKDYFSPPAPAAVEPKEGAEP